MKLYLYVTITVFLIACAPASVSVTAEKEGQTDQIEGDSAEVDSSESLEMECETAPYVTWDNWIKGALSAHCQGCHATTSLYRYGAPENVYFDEEEDALDWLERIDVRVLEEQTMPPAGGLLPEELVLFEIWVRCWN